MNQDKAIQIWNEMISKSWLSENGLARLVHKDEELKNTEFPIYDQLGIESVKNDNGILFLAYFIALSHLVGIKERLYSKQLDFGSTIERLVRLPYRGLFNRTPSGIQVPLKDERHDNYIGICAISKILGFGFTSEIISYGIMNGWNYNNQEPKVFDIKAQRQPGDVSFYLIASGRRPEILGFVHLCIGIMINAFKNDAGQHMLTWLRLYTMNLSDKEQSFIVRTGITMTSLFWKIILMFKYDGLVDMFSLYFGKEHPIVKMSKEAPAGNWGV